MSSAEGMLTEPTVLAHTKRALFPEDNRPAYAVVDTQFSRPEWLDGKPIDAWVREQLSPFNHVRVGGGYPDLVGVRTLDDAFLAVERFGEEPPLVAIEAKGHTGGGVDTERGIVQAYDRLGEANAAYLAAPTDVVTGTDRTLARELNVGILGVDTDGAVRPIEVPRIVGNRTTTEANALRFQARTRGVSDQSFSLNHPKNYLGYVLSHYADGETTAVHREFVVGAVDGSRIGAAFLGLIDDGPGGMRLTPLGHEVVRFAVNEHGSVEAALETFSGWRRSRKRFIDVDRAWGNLARRVLYTYPVTGLLIEELQGMAEHGESEPTLVELVEYLHELHPAFTIEVFVRRSDDVRRRVLTGDGELRTDALTTGSVYHAPTVFQLKTMLYHTGFLTTNGTEPSNLDPTTDVWALREPV